MKWKWDYSQISILLFSIYDIEGMKWKGDYSLRGLDKLPTSDIESMKWKDDCIDIYENEYLVLKKERMK